METTIIDPIPCNLKLENIAEFLKIRMDSPRIAELEGLLDHAQSIARPKAIYKITTVESQDDETILFDGQPFKSRLLGINLGEAHRAFPYIITSGTELHDWKDSFDDFFVGYLADTITSYALMVAIEKFFTDLSQQYGLGKTATMNPGSLEDWPLQAQIPLFSLLDDPGETIGVHLTESLLMMPRHSVSGILFETETDFVNCQLCPREKCPSRRAPYDQGLKVQYSTPTT